MPRQQFGDRVNHDIGPHIKGAKRPRGGECIIHHQQYPPLLCQRRNPCQIRHPQRWVGHQFHQNHPRFRPNSRRHRPHIARIGQRGGNPQTRQILRHQAQRPPIQLIAPQHMIARLQQPHQHRAHRRHPRAQHQAARTALQRIDAPGNHIGIGVPLAGIGIARHAPLILRIQRIRRVAAINNRWHQRRHHRPAGALRQALGAHQGAGIFLHHSLRSGLVGVPHSGNRPKTKPPPPFILPKILSPKASQPCRPGAQPAISRSSVRNRRMLSE